MVKFARDMRFDLDLIPMAATVGVSVSSNMAFGFAAGMAVHYLVQGIQKRRKSRRGQNDQ